MRLRVALDDLRSVSGSIEQRRRGENWGGIVFPRHGYNVRALPPLRLRIRRAIVAGRSVVLPVPRGASIVAQPEIGVFESVGSDLVVRIGLAISRSVVDGRRRFRRLADQPS
jgi:hypothetical protein